MQEQIQKQSSGKSIFCWLITAAVIIVAAIFLWPLFFASEPEFPSDTTLVPQQEEATAEEDISGQLTEGTTIEEIKQDLESLKEETEKLLGDIEAELQQMEQELEQL
jgi:flagellar basal body-associated protein FliL